MAMAVQASLIGIERVVDQALAIYRAHLDRAVEVPLGDMVDRGIGVDAARLSVVAAIDNRVAEIVIDETVVCGQLIQSVWSLAEQGWTTTIVVPAARIGEAHYALRGLPCRLQAWWEEGSTICFGAYENP